MAALPEGSDDVQFPGASPVAGPWPVSLRTERNESGQWKQMSLAR